MSKIKSAKQLTFSYFSGVAFAIIAIHFSVFESTVENLEHFTAQYRLEQIAQNLEKRDITQSVIPLDSFSVAYVGLKNVPETLTVSPDLPLNQAFEIYKEGVDRETDYFVMRVAIEQDGQAVDAYIVNSDPVFELGEEQALKSQTNQIFLSLALLFLSLLVVLRISERLTSPFAALVTQLKQKNKGDLSPLTVPETGKTVELVSLTDSINDYQAQIGGMLERERAFNRFASHELRTPLMVMKGSLTLLEHSNDPAFVEKQRVRMSSAVDAMQDYVEALLSLTREEERTPPWSLDEQQLTTLIAHFNELVEDKPVEVKVSVESAPELEVSMKAVGILIGNLIKNAFTYTDQGHVTITVTREAVTIEDTGIGLDQNRASNHGYGLGLVIANDIARKYGWRIDLNTNAFDGCTATITGLNNKGIKEV
ncbi:sensor histidine kinase [Enterovibrio coralii]|uniref:histidine kinase n=1 Tax=Enterovibrio coralii TaxID=294935 RepID=A0A135I999_9GAMM|nr:HAMP domain-containing sensor histidine kinase [Enterovibrio coralii]KXF82032.1 two-component system sensor protein [Enterovibrio coralii]